MLSDCDIIEENRKRYLNILFPPNYDFNDFEPEDELLTELIINVEQNDICPGYPDSNMNETCNTHFI